MPDQQYKKEQNRKQQKKSALIWGSLMAVMLGGLGWLARPFQSAPEEEAVRPEEVVAEPDRTQAELEAAEKKPREVTREMAEDVPSTTVETAELVAPARTLLISYESLKAFYYDSPEISFNDKENPEKGFTCEVYGTAVSVGNSMQREYVALDKTDKGTIILEIKLSPEEASNLLNIYRIAIKVLDERIAKKIDAKLSSEYSIADQCYPQIVARIGRKNGLALIVGNSYEAEKMKAMLAAETPKEAWVEFAMLAELTLNGKIEDYVLSPKEIEQREQFLAGYEVAKPFIELLSNMFSGPNAEKAFRMAYSDVYELRQEKQRAESLGFSHPLQLFTKGGEPHIRIVIADQGIIPQMDHDGALKSHLEILRNASGTIRAFNKNVAEGNLDARRGRGKAMNVMEFVPTLTSMMAHGGPSVFEATYSLDEDHNMTITRTCGG